MKTSLYAPAVTFVGSAPAKETPAPVDLGDATGVWCEGAPIPASLALVAARAPGPLAKAPLVRRPIAVRTTPRRRPRILHAIVVDDTDRRTPKAATPVAAMTAEFAAIDPNAQRIDAAPTPASTPIDRASFPSASEPQARASSSRGRRREAPRDVVAIASVGAAVAAVLALAIVVAVQHAALTLPVASSATHQTWHPAWSTPWHPAWSARTTRAPATLDVPLARLSPPASSSSSSTPSRPSRASSSSSRDASLRHATFTRPTKLAKEPQALVHAVSLASTSPNKPSTPHEPQLAAARDVASPAPTSPNNTSTSPGAQPAAPHDDDEGFTRVFTAAGFGGSR